MSIACEVYDMYLRGCEELQYEANVINELHANENAHSRILRMLLQYKNGSGYPIYSSFLELMKQHCHEDVSFVKEYKPDIRTEYGRIDLLVREYQSSNKFAIIIENKVCNAKDRDEQIERYIDLIMREGIPPKYIFVIYLTYDGGKQVSNNSLTHKAEEILGIKDNSNDGRFIPLNYRYDILPWIENVVLPTIHDREELLFASITLYVDYLKSLFNLRENDSPLMNKIQNYMKDKLKLESVNDIIESYNAITTLFNQTENILINKASNLLEQHFYRPLDNYFSKKGIIAQISEKENDSCHFKCKIEIQGWIKCWFFITWDSHGTYFNLSHRSIESEEFMLTAALEKIGTIIPRGHSTKWQPWWNYLHEAFYIPNDVNIWRDVENGTLFIKYRDWLEQVIEISKKYQF